MTLGSPSAARLGLSALERSCPASSPHPHLAGVRVQHRSGAPSDEAALRPDLHGPHPTVRFTCWDWLSQAPDARGPRAQTHRCGVEPRSVAVETHCDCVAPAVAEVAIRRRSSQYTLAAWLLFPIHQVNVPSADVSWSFVDRPASRRGGWPPRNVEVEAVTTRFRTPSSHPWSTDLVGGAIPSTRRLPGDRRCRSLRCEAASSTGRLHRRTGRDGS